MIFISLIANYSDLINFQNRFIFGNLLLFLFISGVSITGIIEIKKTFRKNRKYTLQQILSLFVPALLILSIFHKQVGIIATSIFVTLAFVNLILGRKVYALNNVYYFVFLYVFLTIIGTIGTIKGFRFPEMSYSLVLLPLAFCCFRIKKETAFKYLWFFSRIMLIYMACELIYWWFNMQYMNIGILHWLQNKTIFEEIPGYKFVSHWSGYEHPSYISLVLFPALISVQYLFYKKYQFAKISTLEMVVFSSLCLLIELLMQSRIGFVGVLFILIISGLYYLKLKTSFFKIGIIGFVILGVIGAVVLENRINGFTADPVRKTFSTLAINYINNHIWWGIGYHQESIALDQQAMLIKYDMPYLNEIKTYTHNQYLGEMLQYGVLGLIVLIVLFGGLFRYAIRSRNFILQIFLLIYLLFMFIEEPLYVQEGITRFMVFLTFFVHLSESDKSIKSYTLFKRISKS